MINCSDKSWRYKSLGTMHLLFIWLLCIVPPSLCGKLPPKMLKDLTNRTDISMERYHATEQTIMDSNVHLLETSPSWFFGASHEMNEAAQNLTRRALRSETMSMMLVEALKMSPKDAIDVLPTVGADFCNEGSTNLLKIRFECKKLNPKYRTHTGQCNNFLYPLWGAALESYTRLVPPDYQDGVSLPKIDLPSARDVTSKVHANGPDLKHPHLMALTALFGQFLIQDLAHTPKMSLPNGKRLKCCDINYDHFHPECFPIKMDNSVGCMEYTRSAPHPGSIQTCKLGPRQQINQVTSYLDMSSIYGNSEETAKALRSGRDGKMNTQKKNLPLPLKGSKSCRSYSEALPCFFTGDPRANEHPGMALMHVLFLREHNRVAEQLLKVNPHWDDEKLYQEARRIVIAEMQHVTYNEFLPVVLGEEALDKYDVRLLHEGFFKGYDSKIDATISNAVGSAGFFFIAALTPNTLDLVDSGSDTKYGERSLLSAFYAPQELYEAGAIERLIVGATAGHSRKPMPPSLNQVYLERYFHDGKTKDIAVDYAAQTIQQGRDHGLPVYAKWRSFCGLDEISDFQDLYGTMSRETVDKLRRVYRNVQDIDLVTGALSEAPIEGAALGPTFQCLLGRTFHNLRLGDRYWFENFNLPGSFTAEQLQEIRKSTMAKLLCDNSDRLKRMQPRAFILKDPFLNEQMECSSYAKDSIDFGAWKEKTV